MSGENTVFGDIDLACCECAERVFRPVDEACPHCGARIKWSAIEKTWVPRD